MDLKKAGPHHSRYMPMRLRIHHLIALFFASSLAFPLHQTHRDRDLSISDFSLVRRAAFLDSLKSLLPGKKSAQKPASASKSQPSPVQQVPIPGPGSSAVNESNRWKPLPPTPSDPNLQFQKKERFPPRPRRPDPLRDEVPPRLPPRPAPLRDEVPPPLPPRPEKEPPPPPPRDPTRPPRDNPPKRRPPPPPPPPKRHPPLPPSDGIPTQQEEKPVSRLPTPEIPVRRPARKAKSEMSLRTSQEPAGAALGSPPSIPLRPENKRMKSLTSMSTASESRAAVKAAIGSIAENGLTIVGIVESRIATTAVARESQRRGESRISIEKTRNSKSAPCEKGEIGNAPWGSIATNCRGAEFCTRITTTDSAASWKKDEIVDKRPIVSRADLGIVRSNIAVAREYQRRGEFYIRVATGIVAFAIGPHSDEGTNAATSIVVVSKSFRIHSKLPPK
ncbi:hypothetical protein F5887DRAFT_1184865 [Amanita rubescens]|nr:hypothetical protein F5887DRAFT_1184865 [Amanita rubescens]